MACVHAGMHLQSHCPTLPDGYESLPASWLVALPSLIQSIVSTGHGAEHAFILVFQVNQGSLDISFAGENLPETPGASATRLRRLRTATRRQLNLRLYPNRWGRLLPEHTHDLALKHPELRAKIERFQQQEGYFVCIYDRITVRYANKIMRGNVAIPRHTGAAAGFIDQQLAAGRVAFPLARLVEATGLSPLAARKQLERLGGQVVQPSRRHPFFLFVPPEHRAMGAPPIAWWLDDFFNWLGLPYYLALQSAAETYGSAPQALQVTQIMTSKPRREIVLGRLRLQFFVKRHPEHTPTESLASAYAPLAVSTPEATAFDLIRYAARLGGIGRAAETLRPLIPRMRIPELKRVLAAENETSTAQRLGYIIERSGNAKLASAVCDWLPPKMPLIPILPTQIKPSRAPIIAKWRLLKNISEAEL